MRFYEVIVFVLALNVVALVAAGLSIFPSTTQGQVADFTILTIEETDTGIEVQFRTFETVALTGIILIGSVFTGVFISAGIGLFIGTFTVYYLTILPGSLSMTGLSAGSGVGLIIFVMTGVALLAALIDLLTGRGPER